MNRKSDGSRASKERFLFFKDRIFKVDNFKQRNFSRGYDVPFQQYPVKRINIRDIV